MASNETILAWKAELQGAESVKDGLRKINEEVKKGGITQTESNKVVQLATKDTRNFRGEQNLLIRTFETAHPQLTKLTRAFSSFSHIARTGLNIANSLNIMWLRQANFVSAITDKEYELEVVERKLSESIRKTGEDSQATRDLLAERNRILNEIANIKFDKTTQSWIDLSTWINSGFVEIASVGAFLKITFPAFFDSLVTSITGAITGFTNFAGAVVGFFANPALSQGLPFFVSQFLGLIPGMKELKIVFSDFLHSLGTIDATWLDQAIPDFFNIIIPMAIGNAGAYLTNFFLVDMPKWGSDGLKLLSDAFIATWNSIISTTNLGVNAVISGVNSIINGAISAINAFISAINNILKKAKLGTISLIPKFQGIPTIDIPLIKAATGFNGMVNRPTTFLAGEAGPESVSITPNGGSNGGGITVVVNVQGSILTERELFRRVDENLKNELKKRNFRILQ